MEILDNDASQEYIVKLKQEVEQSIEVKSIFGKMHPDGYWLETNPRNNVTLGRGVEYGVSGTTHFVLSYLSELGLTREDHRIEKAANRYLDLINNDGDWWGHMSCLNGFNIRSFIRLGYRGDFRLEKAIELMLVSGRYDGGYLCDMHEKERKFKKKKSCYRGSLKALMAFAELPELSTEKSCLNLVEYFLNREVIFNSKGSEFVNRDIHSLSYPITWRASTLEALFSLSKMGYGAHKSLSPAWAFLETKKGESGKYILDWTSRECPFKVGKRGEENDWISFYVALAEKYRNE